MMHWGRGEGGGGGERSVVLLAIPSLVAYVYYTVFLRSAGG